MPGDDSTLRRALDRIEAAFADAPRPSDAELLHERCFDDGDIARLYPIAHWRELPDALVESEYAALSFLSPDGFRHFIPAYMRFTLRHLGANFAVIDSTIWSLAPVFYEDPALREFVVSKLATLTEAQRAAVVAFLDAVRELGDEYVAGQAEQALTHGRPILGG